MDVDAVRPALRRLRWAVTDTERTEEAEVEGRPVHVVTDDEGAVEVTRGAWAALERFRRRRRGDFALPAGPAAQLLAPVTGSLSPRGISPARAGTAAVRRRSPASAPLTAG